VTDLELNLAHVYEQRLGLRSAEYSQATVRGDDVVIIFRPARSLVEAMHGAVKQMHSCTTPSALVPPIETIDWDHQVWRMVKAQEHG